MATKETKSPKDKKPPKQSAPQSPELAAGSGFTFEDAVAAYYLASLLSEGYAPGLPDQIVSKVSLQQRDFDAPLDDVIVHFRDSDGSQSKLSLQVKRALVISAAKSNKDFRDVIRDCWKTYTAPDFRPMKDRYGVAVEHISIEKARDLGNLCDLARASSSAEHFTRRFAKGGNASKPVKSIKNHIATLVEEILERSCSDEEIHEFLSGFVVERFDFLHDGAISPAQIISQLRGELQPDHFDDAPLLWSKLRTIARDSAGRSAEIDRKHLVRLLSNLVRLRGAHSLRSDLERLTQLAHDWVADIQNDVGGTHLERQKLRRELDEAISSSRFVQIRGLPGSGKSVLLRQRVEQDLQNGGPVLFLKSDRLSGGGWTEFATANALSGAALPDLLAEVEATGSSTLYVDGIDRIEKKHQAILTDVMRTIVRTPELANWKIVVSLRDTGVEPLRNWLASVLDSLLIETVRVDSLDDDEAEVLAEARPALRPFLFGGTQVREIVRRPFFAKVLNQTFASQPAVQGFSPQSELDLIENWWLRGGYDSTGQEALARQRALIDIGAHRARQLSKPVKLSDLAPGSISVVAGLISDGLIQPVKAGISVRFSHDIFFEWSFYYVLSERGENWLDELRACGEPPAVARVVELLSQSEYLLGPIWATSLETLASAKMRSQWTRAWLLGPIGSPVIDEHDTLYAKVVSENDYRLLQKALVWFQAEKTTPNMNVLAQDLPADQRIRIADYLAWPSDIPTWRRFLSFVTARIETVPVALYPDITALFAVWQHIARDVRNSVSKRILEICADWLREIDLRNKGDEPPPPSKWDEAKDLGDLRTELANLVLGAARTMPHLVSEYLQRLIDGERVRDDRLKAVLDFSPLLATTHPDLLVQFTLKALTRELPDQRYEREQEEMRQSAAARAAIRAKPEHERTRNEQMFLSGGHILGGNSFSYHDWDHPSLEDGFRGFWPPSPAREPFFSLFAHAPTHAIKLLNALCNHAITAWRQLHRHIYDSPGTPVALELQFPWGRQTFWGGDREYLWCRQGPHIISAGLMALEDWCFVEHERGISVDNIIRRIVEGNECIAVLATASVIALHADQVSEAVFPLIASQRLLVADWNRMSQALSESNAALMGFKPHEAGHAKVVANASARSARRKTLRWLAQRYVLDSRFGDQTRTAFLGFKDELPFQMEEHRNLAEAQRHLREQAAEFAELASLENYRMRPLDNEGRVEVFHVSPTATKPENVAKVEQAELSLRESSLWIWADRSFEKGAVEDLTRFPEAISLAKQRDRSRLFRQGTAEDLGTRRGAVAGTAAMVLCFREGRSESELRWARRVLLRAIRTPETPDAFWTPQSVIPWHQGIFSARGLAADVRHGTDGQDTRLVLLSLIAHPLEAVALTAFSECMNLADLDPKLAWAAIFLGLSLCHVDPLPPGEHRNPRSPIHDANRIESAVRNALRYYSSEPGWIPLPLPPPAWIKTEGESARNPEEFDFEFENGEVIEGKRWAESPGYWQDRFASRLLAKIPYEGLCRSDAKGPLLDFAANVLTWTNAKNAPPWLKKGRRDRESSRLFEWTHQLGRTLAHLSGFLPFETVRESFLDPILALEGETCWAILAPFTSTFICAHVLDEKDVPKHYLAVLEVCLERLLASPNLKSRNSYRAGEFSGSNEPTLARSLMFVQVELAMGAARFVNGDWGEIGLILPIVDRFVRRAGWSASVMDNFLTLCERARGAYPAQDFADQVLEVIGNESLPLPRWQGTFMFARIACLVQHFADRDTPMPLALGQDFLKILDLLVDKGDRRSAALQLSETFREIKIA